MNLTAELKLMIYKACMKVLAERVDAAQHAMQSSQEAANGEEKSSAGDKFETSRAMGQRDREMYARQYLEAKNEFQKTERLNLEYTPFIKVGSLIRASDNFYFIATGIGKLEVEGITVMAVSKESPIAGVMLGKSIGDEFKWNDKIWKIDEIK